VSEILIEKLPQSWTDYKQQLKHKHKQMSLSATCKQASDRNSTFVIGDPMNKVHMSKNKSLGSFASINIDLKSIFSILMLCVEVLDTALSRG